MPDEPLRLPVVPEPPPPTLAEVVAKLRHGADSEFSTPLKPAECSLLLRELGEDETRTT